MCNSDSGLFNSCWFMAIDEVEGGEMCNGDPGLLKSCWVTAIDEDKGVGREMVIQGC